MIWRKWKNLRIQNQILIIQSIVIVSLLVILILLSFELVNRFSIFIQHELFQTLILKSMVSTIQITTERVNQLQFIQYFQQVIDMRSQQNLFTFYASNNIQMSQQVEDCLQREYSEQFYSYHFCYGIYGEQSNSTDLNQIKGFIALQNLFVPFNFNKLEQTYYTIYLDQTLFLSQYQGQYLQSIDPDLMDVFNQMDQSPQIGYYKEIKRNDVSIQLNFNNIPGTKIATGTLYEQREDEFDKISQLDSYFNQRQLFVFDSGDIIYDSKNPHYIEGLMFQNTSLTGFDETQFQKIKNFTYENRTVINECSLHVKKKFLCLVDSSGGPKIMQIDRFGSQDWTFYYIIILDAKSSIQTIDAFDKKLQDSINELIRNIVIYLTITLVICFTLQMLFIKNLNKPLNDLKDIAKFHINNEQYNILTGMSVIQTQNQIQKLADSFFNLINLNQTNKNSENFYGIKQIDKIKYTQGILQKRYLQIILRQIRQQIIGLKGYRQWH